MESDFERSYRLAVEKRMREARLAADDSYHASLRRGSARRMAEPFIQAFAREARSLLEREGVWCEEFWPLPYAAGNVRFTLDKVRSRRLRPVWNVQYGQGFLCLTKDGVVMNYYDAVLPKDPDRMYDTLRTGGDDYPESLRLTLSNDYGFGPALWLNTDSGEVFVINNNGSYSLSVQPFVEWGAGAIDAVVTGWRNRQS